MGLLGILVGLGLLIWMAFRGWSVLLLAPAAALIAAAFGGEPLLAQWTQTFMGSAARFLAQFFPPLLLGAVFGKLMDDSGSVLTVADFMARRLGERHAIPGVVFAGVPKNGMGMVFWIEGVPGSADMVKVELPSTTVAGTSRRGMSATRNSLCAIGTRTKKATNRLTPPYVTSAA